MKTIVWITSGCFLCGVEPPHARNPEGGHGQKRGRSEEQETRSERVTKAMRQAGAAASGMARAAARTVWTMMGGRHVEETAEKSGPPRAGDHGEPGEAATGDG